MSSPILEDTFHRWTDERSEIESRISIYNHIRDIPYALVRGFTDPVLGSELLLTQGKGSCYPKHHLLNLFFTRIGIQVRLERIPFFWDDPGIRYPTYLRILAHEIPRTYHLTSYAYLNSHWVLVDATWDIPLGKAGFPVNDTWDGVSDTLPAVTKIDGSEDLKLLSGKNAGIMLDKRNLFYDQLNIWLETLRENPKKPRSL